MKTNVFFKVLAVSLVVSFVAPAVHAMQKEMGEAAATEVYLAKHGGSVNAALLAAAEECNVPVICGLLTYHGANKNAHTALFKAADQYFERPDDVVAAVKSLLLHGVDINATDLNGRTLLHVAAQRGMNKIVDVLLAHNARVNVYDNGASRATPLENALLGGNIDSAIALLNKGAAAHFKDNTNSTLFHAFTYCRSCNGSFDDIRVLVALLIKNGADLNARNNRGQTALYLAVNRNDVNVELVQVLLEAGADVNIPNSKGETSLQVAERRHNHDVAKMLREALDHDPDCNDLVFIDVPVVSVSVKT